MEYKNNTQNGIKVPFQQGGLKPVGYVTFHPGDIKEVPENARNAALLLGLEEHKEEPKEMEQKQEEPKKKKEEVKAFKSSVKKTVVETKQIEED